MNFLLSNVLFILKALIGLSLYISAWNIALANNLIIDDRTSGNLSSNLGTQWRMVTDQVMGGVSNGELTLDNYKGKNCLRIRGDVSTENNGGFVQMALDLTNNGAFDASSYAGVEIIVSGNNEHYNFHFRTTELWLPWQSYRYSFKAISDWQTIYIPFKDLKAYRTTTKFHRDKLKRIGLVAIGRNFKADLCVASIKLYTLD
ncbi:Complex I intermediate-associated protein 30 (CIA30) [Nitrosomonas marina]|uniref:Complex I intermediate-associated protein 30 (CIA30) n=1 Tax=Nitrosomonas marina TaxID=917 RepID=A0A1I0G8Z1_9PROT|nr:CIA30 family protein [Nitrosomonas marina]SET66434.1 Complex I intermediate-associated protein 30 (CIA30) [Nitrosomonas marina]